VIDPPYLVAPFLSVIAVWLVALELLSGQGVGAQPRAVIVQTLVQELALLDPQEPLSLAHQGAFAWGQVVPLDLAFLALGRCSGYPEWPPGRGIA
tara:strand:- start:919 stop:1203 length:285 start_codon:yes stop_codon:yes gene_type:complete